MKHGCAAARRHARRRSPTTRSPPSLPALQDMFAEAGEVMDAVVTGDVSKVDDLSQLGTKFTETSEAFQEICEP